MTHPSLRRFPPLLAAFLASIAACNSSARPPRCPAQGGRWRELVSKHFIVVTDVDEPAARAASREFETEFEQLRAVAFHRVEESPRVTVVLFDNPSERFAFRSATTSADYTARSSDDFDEAPTIVLDSVPYASEAWVGRKTFLHELTHHFIAYTYGGVPMWLNEGLSQYLETLKVDGGRATVGAVPYGYAITRGFAPTVEELLKVNRRDFYGAEQQTMAGDNARNRYYRGSWAFVHFLHDGPSYVRAGFAAFMKKLDAGEDAKAAWQETLGRIPKLEMERAFYDYTNGYEWSGVERPIASAPAAPLESVRSLRDDEVHVVWARLANPSLPSDDPRSSEAQLAEAVRSAPASPDVRYAVGVVALEEEREDVALKSFEAAMAMAPDDPRYVYGALEAIAALQAGGRNVRAKGNELLARLAATARTADELSMVARTRADRGDDAGAVSYAERAVAADPGSYVALVTRAFVHFRAGRYTEAVRDQERALALVNGRTKAQALGRVLAVYRDALEGRSLR
jgi:Tfp pilus assembly protein PilF